MADTMLTTFDNPFNPHTQYEEWLAFDEDRGYYTNALLSRIAVFSDELSEADQELAIDYAIDEIVGEYNVGSYRKVTEDSWKDLSRS